MLVSIQIITHLPFWVTTAAVAIEHKVEHAGMSFANMRRSVAGAVSHFPGHRPSITGLRSSTTGWTHILGGKQNSADSHAPGSVRSSTTGVVSAHAFVSSTGGAHSTCVMVEDAGSVPTLSKQHDATHESRHVNWSSIGNMSTAHHGTAHAAAAAGEDGVVHVNVGGLQGAHTNMGMPGQIQHD